MGLAFGDLNCDGALDLFASNFGDYALGVFGVAQPLGQSASRWFLGRGDGTFSDPKVGNLIATPFGWGNAIFDYDNDADLDILMHGGLDASTLVIADNPGTIFQNQGCSANFVIDFDAIPDDPTCVDPTGQPIPNCTEHTRRNVRGVAVGDLDRDGFSDIVTVANAINHPPLPLLPTPDQYGSVFDGTAFFVPLFAPTPDGLVWIGLNSSPGDLAVEISSGNANWWVTVTVRGSIGLTRRGRVNRDGIGAVVSFTPDGGPTVMSPVTGGSSHLSQHSLERIFGLGSATSGTVDVLWPGGVRNRLYGVRAGERLVFPEIPVSFDDDSLSFPKYLRAVVAALAELKANGIITPELSQRLFRGALTAYYDRFLGFKK